jgi:hypothetical protein
MKGSPYSPPKVDLETVPQGATVPYLWNPHAAAGWSLLFTVIFGALVLRRNWLALGERERAAWQVGWIVGGLLWLLLALPAFLFLPGPFGSLFGRFAGLVILLGWYATSVRRQHAYIAERWGRSYPRKSWLLPLALGFLVLAPLVFFLAALAFLMTMFSGAPLA